jgi:hypothetical protein
LEERGLQKVSCVGVEWVPMPLDPDIRLTGLSANTAKMFASAVYPCVIEFHEQVEVPAPAASRPAGGDEEEEEVVESAAPAAPPTGQVVQLQWWMELSKSFVSQ